MTLSDASARHITSSGNSRYKLWEKYLKKPADPECPWIAVECLKQVLELKKYRNPELLLLSDDLEPTGFDDLMEISREVIHLPGRLLNRLSAVRNSQGIIAFFRKPCWTEKDLTDKVIFLEDLQDPGNLGTIIRTAAAMGGYSIISSGKSVSFFNEKVVRASAGYLFIVPFYSGYTTEELRKAGYQIWYSFPSKGIPLQKADLTPPLAVVFGSEGKGLDWEKIAETEKKLTILMSGKTDSLNVAVASSLVMYEIDRKVNSANG